ncbi:hypothetical protein JCM11641_001803 [Rhodosporidiobolus odoratus]
MDDTPRRSTQANRQQRRTSQSPYSRPQPQPQPTPSRLRSLLSYVSPFRAARQELQVEVEQEDRRQRVEDDAAQSAGEDSVKHEDGDSADEAARFALHGGTLTNGRDYTSNVPASPFPANSTFSRKSTFRSFGTPLASSASLPNLAAVSIPRTSSALSRSPMNASTYSEEDGPSSATHELARFFQEKAERGKERLTAIEQAGVMQLMQQAQTESTLPTAFTPNFRNVSPPRTALSFPGSASLNPPAPPVAGGSIFSAPASEVSVSASTAGANGVGRKRRRPLYVGAGYSSRRRNTAKSAAAGGLVKSQSESSLFALSAEPSTTSEGKKRRTMEDNEEDDIPVASLDDIVALPSPSKQAGQVGTEKKGKEMDKPKLQQQPSFSRFAAGVSTPAKPSPLWQVSQVDTPSPSPPRKPTPASSSSLSASPALTSTSKTAAANLMLGIIAESTPTAPSSVAEKKKPTVVEKEKQAILNPYAASGEEEDLLSAGRKERVPRSRAHKAAAPGRGRRADNEAKAEAEKKKKEAEKESPLEQLERTMPAEYRPAKRTKAVSPPPAPAPASKSSSATATKKATPEPARKADKPKKAKPVEVMQLSSSEDEIEVQDDEEDEDQLEGLEADEEMQEREDEEEEEEEEPEEDVILAPLPAPSAAAKKSAFSFSPSSASSSPTSASSSTFSFGAPAAASAPFLAKPAAPSSSTFSFSAPAPSTSSPASAPATDPKSAALALPRSSLPLGSFSFAGVFQQPTQGVKGDKAAEAVQALVKEMGRGELPSFAF